MSQPTVPGSNVNLDAAPKRPWEPPELIVIEIDALTARSPNPHDVPTGIGTVAS